jgi:hypothetical protein
MGAAEPTGGETMNRTFVVSVVVMFVVSSIMGFVVHGMILGADYARLTFFRTHGDFMQHYAAMAAANLIWAIGFTWIYRQGRDRRHFVGQGVRFGLAVAVLAVIPTYLIYYAVQPMPSDLVAEQIVLDTIAMLIMGVIVAALNRDASPARA